MRAKIRREVSQLLIELKIPSKLYRGHRLAYLRGGFGEGIKRLRDKLLLSKPGTLVQDCDGFNHVVKKLVTYAYAGRTTNHRGLTSFQNDTWRRRGYTFVFPQVEFEDGNYSCGCEGTPEPPETRELIERRALHWYLNPNPGWPLTEMQIKRKDALLRGEHITDGQGVLLEEFRGY